VEGAGKPLAGLVEVGGAVGCSTHPTRHNEASNKLTRSR
jgi:hypothetical protein